MLKKGFGNFIMNNDKEFLATEPIGKLLLRLAIPTLAAQMINMLYNIIDRIYIGHIPGSGALALTGVGVCMPLIMIISAFAALVGNGGAPRASIEGTEKVDYTVYIWYNVSIKYRRCFYDRTTAEIDAKSIHGNI